MRNPAPRRHTVSFGVLLGAALLVACVAPAVEPIAPDEIEEPDAPVGSQTWLPGADASTSRGHCVAGNF